MAKDWYSVYERKGMRSDEGVSRKAPTITPGRPYAKHPRSSLANIITGLRYAAVDFVKTSLLNDPFLGIELVDSPPQIDWERQG
jgi:hypothetical protein